MRFGELPPARRKVPPRLVRRIPVALADRLHHPLDDLGLRGRIVALEPAGKAEVAAVAHEGVVNLLPLVRPDRGGVRDLPAPEIVDRLRDLHRARIALLLEAGDPVRVQRAGAHLVGQEPAGRDDPRGRIAQVGNMELGAPAIEVAHGERQAAEIFEGVVGGEHAVQPRGAGQHRALNAAQIFGEDIGARGNAPMAAAIGILQPGEIGLRQRRLVLPGRGPEGLFRQAGAIIRRRIAEDPQRGELGRALRRLAGLNEPCGDPPAVARHRIVRLVQRRDLFDGTGQKPDEAVELVTVDAGHLQYDVDARAAELGARHDVDRDETPGRVPGRPQPERMHHLALDDAEMAHGFARPQAEGELVRKGAVMGRPMGLQQLAERHFARLVGGAGRHLVGFETEEIAPARNVRIAHGIAAGPRRDKSAGKAVQQRFHLARLAKMPVERGGPFQHGAQGRVGDVRHRRAAAQMAFEKPIGRGPGQRAGIAGRHLVRIGAGRGVERPAELLHDGRQPVLGRRGSAKRMKAERHGVARKFVQMIVERREEAGKIPGDRLVRPAHVAGKAARRHEPPDPGAGPLAHRAVLELGMLMDPGVKIVQFAIEAGRREGRRLVADRHCPAPAPRLDRLGHIVLDIGVEDRQVADGEPGIVARGKAAVLAGRPFLRAMGAEMNERIGTDSLAEMQIGGEVPVARRHRHVVVARPRLVAARKLRQDRELAEQEARNGEVPFA